MAKTVEKESSWNQKNEGPFRVIRRNQGGSYLLEDLRGEPVPYRFPSDHLVLLPHFNEEAVKLKDDESRFAIRKILDHKGSGEDTEYLVAWENKKLPETWTKVSQFDNRSKIEEYLKRERKQNPEISNKRKIASKIQPRKIRIVSKDLLRNEKTNQELEGGDVKSLPPQSQIQRSGTVSEKDESGEDDVAVCETPGAGHAGHVTSAGMAVGDVTRS